VPPPAACHSHPTCHSRFACHSRESGNLLFRSIRNPFVSTLCHSPLACHSRASGNLLYHASGNPFVSTICHSCPACHSDPTYHSPLLVIPAQAGIHLSAPFFVSGLPVIPALLVIPAEAGIHLSARFGRPRNGRTPNLLIRSQYNNMSIAYHSVYCIHTAHKIRLILSIASIVSIISTGVAPALHRERRLKKNRPNNARIKEP
jgi:hypothetical protein